MKITLLLAAALGLGGFLATRSFKRTSRSPALAASISQSQALAGNTSTTAAKPSDPSRPTHDQILAADLKARLGLLIRWLPAASTEELTNLAISLEETHGWFPGVWEALARRWVEVAPDAAIKFARSLSEDNLKGHTESGAFGVYNVLVKSVEVYRALLQQDLELGLTNLAGERGILLTQLLRQLTASVEKSRREIWATAHADLPEAVAWAAKPGAEAAPRVARFDLHNLSPEAKEISALLKTDLAGGRAKIDALPQNYHRALLEIEYAAALAKQDSPAAAAAWAKSNLQGLVKMQAIAQAALELSKTDPLKALKMLQDNKVPDFGKNMLGVVEVTTGSSGSTYYNGGNRTMLKETLTAAAMVDPKATMDYLLTSGGVLPRDMHFRYVDNGDTDNNGSLGRNIYKDWVTKDPKAAAMWLAAQNLSSGLAEMLPVVAGPLATQGGSEGRDFITSLPNGPMRQELLAHAAAQWAQEDGTAALQWAATNGGSTGLNQAFDLLAQKNAEIASQQFGTLPPEVQGTQLQSLTNALGVQKPQALPEFFSQISPELQGSVDLRKVIDNYANLNIEQASSWLDQLPASKAKDSGISGLVDYLLNNKHPDPEAAAHWAAVSSDPEAQARRLERVAKAWQKQNPNGAADAIRNSQLNAPVQQQLLNFLKPNSK